MREFLSNKYLQFTLRLIIGVIFIYASVNKLFNAEEFAKAIKNYDMLPLFIINFMAIIMPYVEFFTGILLITGIYKRGSSAIVVISLVVFLIALTSAYARGLDINCGCFSLETTSSKSDILFRIFEDVMMLIVSVLVFAFSGKNKDEKINTEIN
jgi:putative oxidoreductase